MHNKSENFSTEEIIRFANSPAGKKLMALLQNTNSANLQSAAEEPASGNFESAQKKLSPLLNSPEVQALIKQMGK